MNKTFAFVLFAIVFLLRIFYAGFVWADEGLWFTAAQELLRGKSLYSQIWFDKQPAVAWVYAALFGLAGPSVIAVRAFTIAYATAVSLALWHIGRNLIGESEGRLAALLYAIYNAAYIQSQVQPMAVDQLMLLPYLYSGYLFLRGRAFWAGVLAATAFWINPKAGVLLVLFVLVSRSGWALVAAGFAAASAPWLAYVMTGGRWEYYVRDFWGWGFSYVTVYSPAEAIANGARRVLNYAAFHFPLMLGVIVAMWRARVPRALWWWLGLSFLGVAAGGRFFPRYFYQVLPLLCPLAACGYLQLMTLRRASVWRVVFWAGVLFAVVRFEARAAVHAYEIVTGKQTAYNANWSDTAMDRDSRLIAQHVHGPLFVWGYRPEIYFYCGCPAASAFLSSQPLTGVPADIHLRESRSAAPERAEENRRRLLAELESAPPPFIVDGLGPYNPALAMTAYPELRAFVEQHYRLQERLGHGDIYSRSP